MKVSRKLLMLIVIGTLISGCREERADLNRALASGGLPYAGDQDRVFIHFAGRRLPVYVGSKESEPGTGYLRACCSKEDFYSFDPQTTRSFSTKGIYRARVSSNVYVLVGVPFDGMPMEDAMYLIHAKCTANRYLFTILNDRQLPSLFAAPELMCRATAP